jgi:hypothetical protein
MYIYLIGSELFPLSCFLFLSPFIQNQPMAPVSLKEAAVPLAHCLYSTRSKLGLDIF